MSKEERYAEHTVAWELPNGDSVTKSNYNLADIETKYMPIQTEVICDDKDKTISDLEEKLVEKRQDCVALDKAWNNLNNQLSIKNDEINELKQQLAEKDEVIANYKTMYESVVQTCSNDLKEIKKLKKQNNDYADSLTKVLNENADLVFKLTDKEKEYKQIKDKLHTAEQETLHFQNKYFAEKQIAIEELEKVKEFLAKRKGDYLYLKDEIKAISYNQYVDFVNEVEIFELKVDNQIKAIKEGK